MARVLVLAAARAVRGRLFLPLDEHVADSADAGGVLRHPTPSLLPPTQETVAADSFPNGKYPCNWICREKYFGNICEYMEDIIEDYNTNENL